MSSPPSSGITSLVCNPTNRVNTQKDKGWERPQEEVDWQRDDKRKSILNEMVQRSVCSVVFSNVTILVQNYIGASVGICGILIKELISSEVPSSSSSQELFFESPGVSIDVFGNESENDQTKERPLLLCIFCCLNSQIILVLVTISVCKVSDTTANRNENER